jgi:hypothetical protein
LLDVTAEDRRLVDQIAALRDGIFAGGAISDGVAPRSRALAS